MAAAVATTPKMSSRGESAKSTTSAAGILALLEEPQDVLKVHGLRMLNDYAMHTSWHEVASAIEIIEGMHEDEFFSHRDLAALVASKVRSFSFRSYCKRERESKVAFGDLLYVRKEMRRF
jgi:hypothetical protein